MKHHKQITGENLRDFILGAQDGIVNVLGLVLGVASATLNTSTVLIAGIAGLFAESISMGAVAFTSTKAAHDYYKSNKRKKEQSLYKNPFKIGMFVFWATILGSIVPILPFFFFSVKTGIIASVVLSGLILFIIGSVKGKLTIGGYKSGVEMLIVGLVAALAGYLIGILLGAVIT
ncbi:MAG: VIT1/CCC1 transporter family protein [Nanoarchaeota archaeon]|mgnify:FL=1